MHLHIKPAPFGTEAIDLGLELTARRVEIRAQAELSSLLQKLEDWMRVYGYATKEIFSVSLALDEAVTNAVRHGNRSDPSKLVQVCYLVSATEVWLEVQDQGPGFDPSQVPDPIVEAYLDRPGGRGLFLMRAYMDSVSYNPRGNRVTLGKRRTP
jgi:serine/threonine-protein kinase RsbW